MPGKTVGQRLLQARLESGAQRSPPKPVSQAEIGRALSPDVTGVTVGAWEADKNEPGIEAITQLAVIYGVRAAWLAFGEEPMRAPDQAPPALPAAEESPRPAKRVATVRTDVPHAKLDRMERERAQREEEERQRAAAAKKRRRA